MPADGLSVSMEDQCVIPADENPFMRLGHGRSGIRWKVDVLASFQYGSKEVKGNENQQDDYQPAEKTSLFLLLDRCNSPLSRWYCPLGWSCSPPIRWCCRRLRCCSSLCCCFSPLSSEYIIFSETSGGRMISISFLRITMFSFEQTT